MNYNKAKKFLKSNISEDHKIDRVLGMLDQEARDLLLKLKNNKNIQGKICNTYDDIEIEEIKINLTELDVYYSKKLYEQLNKCKKRYKIIYVIIKFTKGRHINILLVDNKKKTVERFDTFDELTKNKEKIIKVILNKLNIKYKFINPTNYIFSSKRKDCGLCVPLSFLYIYLKIYYDLKLDEVINLLSGLTNLNLFSISSWFVNYLNDE